MQLLDDSAETATSQVQELEAFLLRHGVVFIISLVRRVVPNLPMRITRLVEAAMRKQTLPGLSGTPTIE